MTAWTSLLPVIPVSHFQPPESEQAQKTLGTSGHLSQTEFGFSDPSSASLKMSKDTSPSDSAKSLENWKALVTRRRGEYSLRVKSARLTSASACLSWPTISVNESKNSVGKSQLNRNSIPLGTMVVKEAANWPTPDASNHRDGEVLRTDNNLEHGGFHGVSLHHAMTKYGQVAPANPSTLGSRQGLSEENWVTPRTSGTSTRPNKTTPRQGLTLIEQARANEWRTPGASDGEGGVMEMREGCAGKYKLRDHVVAVQKQEWRTPTVAEEKNQNTSKQIYLQNQVGATAKQWATPQAHDAQGPKTPEQIEAMRAKGHGVKNLNEQATWPTPSASCDQGGPSGLAGGSGNRAKLNAMLPEAEAKAMGCGKLNPRWVETLMGLPIGWTMPSCIRPVTIELTSCASSATESSQPPQPELF